MYFRNIISLATVSNFRFFNGRSAASFERAGGFTPPVFALEGPSARRSTLRVDGYARSFKHRGAQTGGVKPPARYLTVPKRRGEKQQRLPSAMAGPNFLGSFFLLQKNQKTPACAACGSENPLAHSSTTSRSERELCPG